MQKIIILAILFVTMLLAPIICSAIYYKKRKGMILYINQNRIRNPRYFADSFSKMIRSNLNNASGHRIRLSREEEFLDERQLTKQKGTVEHLVICQKQPFHSLQEITVFEKEIYSAKEAVFDKPKLSLRGAYSEKRMIVGNDTEVVRWIDAEETLAIYDNCDLGISASAGKRMSIGKNCRFQRLYAPEILAGQYPGSSLAATDGRNPKIYRLPIKMEKEDNIRHISKEDINEEGIVEFSVRSWKNVIVTEGVIVQGDIRSHRGVRLREGAVVCGNIFAEQDVYLEKNATVLGCIFSQGDIHLEEYAVVGQKGRICSMIARHHIIIERNCFIFGYISCERGGRIVEKTEESQNDRRWTGKYCFLEAPSYLEHLRFQNLYEYEHVDQQGFRREKKLQDVVIPAGAQKIARSMFFDCRELKEVESPSSLRVIGDYAFADCSSLRDVHGFSVTQLESIGISAFENCAALTSINFPASLKELGEAAFAGCINLEQIVFPETGNLVYIGDHCFKGCKTLKSVYLPDTVEKIGISAFKDCTGLKKISLPEVCRQEPGILILSEQHPEIVLEFRRIKDSEEQEGKYMNGGGEQI